MNIYFLLAAEHKYVKIGTTIQPNKRYHKLSKENMPFELYMIVIKNSPITEHELHVKFKSCHKTREWFHGNPELYRYIQELFINCHGVIISKKANIIPEELWEELGIRIRNGQVRERGVVTYLTTVGDYPLRTREEARMVSEDLLSRLNALRKTL